MEHPVASKPSPEFPMINVGKLNSKATYARTRPLTAVDLPDPLDGIEITDEYCAVESLLVQGCPIVFVTGKAGTGKTTLIHYLRHKLNKNIVVVAPTGVAALNIKGATIHSFFRFPARIVNDDDIKKLSDRKLYTRLDLLVIDEISMVRADLMDAMDKFLRLNGRNPDKPFGGTQLLIVGDLFQLPPVVTREEESVLFARPYTSPFFFSAKALQDCAFAPVELTRIYRQTDPEFMEMLNKIRVAENLESVIPVINDACYSRDVQDSFITLTCTNARADQINLAELDELPGEPRTFVGMKTGKFRLEDSRLPSPMDLKLKPGAQVMFTKNDGEKRWVNGTLGQIVAFKENSIQVELVSDHPGSIHDVQQVTWETYKYEYDYRKDRIKHTVIGRYTQYPLMLAWAVTIHKSQGKTLEKVRLDVGSGAFASGQVYVALSRCRSLEDLSLARAIQARDVKCDQRIKRFYLGVAAAQPSDHGHNSQW
jgi:hypothetical protein